MKCYFRETVIYFPLIHIMLPPSSVVTKPSRNMTIQFGSNIQPSEHDINRGSICHTVTVHIQYLRQQVECDDELSQEHCVRNSRKFQRRT